VHVLQTGAALVDVSAYRDDLLAIRRGQRAWDEVTGCAADLSRELRAALGRTDLPAEPDRAGCASPTARA
jgi:uncharacterized protein